MSQSLAKYHARSPRYVLQPQDNTLIRVAGPKQVPWEEGTEIRNISLSGLAFTAAPELCPIVGEIIRIEFQIPGSKKMACHGLVTRLEPGKSSEMLVGVHFVKLEMPHRVALLQGLAQKLKEQHIKDGEGLRAQKPNKTQFSQMKWPWVILLGFTLSAWIAIFALSSNAEFFSKLAAWIAR